MCFQEKTLVSKLNDKSNLIRELSDVNNELLPLKELADRELASIYGLNGLVYTPHIDKYMAKCIKKAEILALLKTQSILPLSEVEVISSILDKLFKKAKNYSVVEYKGAHYERRFLPLKLTKSGKNVQRWAKIWLLQLPNGKTDPYWESQVHEIWPKYFLIRTINL